MLLLLSSSPKMNARGLWTAEKKMWLTSIMKVHHNTQSEHNARSRFFAAILSTTTVYYISNCSTALERIWAIKCYNKQLQSTTYGYPKRWMCIWSTTYLHCIILYVVIHCTWQAEKKNLPVHLRGEYLASLSSPRFLSCTRSPPWTRSWGTCVVRWLRFHSHGWFPSPWSTRYTLCLLMSAHYIFLVQLP